MSFLIDFFSSLIGTIHAFLDLIISTITSMLKIITMIPIYMSTVINMLNYLPSWLYAYMGLMLIIMIIWGIRKAL